jgi:hypothetical protein
MPHECLHYPTLNYKAAWVPRWCKIGKSVRDAFMSLGGASLAMPQQYWCRVKIIIVHLPLQNPYDQQRRIASCRMQQIKR